MTFQVSLKIHIEIINFIFFNQRKYNDLKFKFEIIDVQSLPSPHSRELVLSAQLNVKLYV